jgi:hypothetical protein
MPDPRLALYEDDYVRLRFPKISGGGMMLRYTESRIETETGVNALAEDDTNALREAVKTQVSNLYGLE